MTQRLLLLALLLVFLLLVEIILCQSNATGVFGGSVRIEYMQNSTAATNKTILFTHDNSTLFTASAPMPPPEGVWGELIPFSPIDACGPLELSNYTRNVGNRVQFVTTGPYPHVVALVARGNCSFEEKFDFVDDVPNVIGLLMYDYEDGGNLSNYIELSSFEFLNIPGFLIENKPGVELKRRIDDMRMQDRRPSSSPQWIKVTLKHIPHVGAIENILQYALLLVMLLLCCAFLASVYMHYHLYRLQRRLDENRQAEARNAINIDESFLEKLPVRRFRRAKSPVSIDLNDGAGVSKVTRNSPTAMAPVEDEDEHLIHATAPPNETCPICLDEFGQFENLNELPCGHFYHISCIRPWLQNRSPCCPMCKEDVRDAFVVLPPLEEEKSFFRVTYEGLREFSRKWMCCAVCCSQKNQEHVYDHDHERDRDRDRERERDQDTTPQTTSPSDHAPMSEVRIVTPPPPQQEREGGSPDLENGPDSPPLQQVPLEGQPDEAGPSRKNN